MVVDQRDFAFLLSWMDLDGLMQRPRFQGHAREDVDAVLQLAEKVAANELATHLRASDIREPQLDAAGLVQVLPEVAQGVRVMADTGLFSTMFDEDHGGLQLPHLVHVCAMGMLMSANLATASFMLLTVGNARLLTTYGTPAQIKAFAEPQIAGSALGTMCLSESQAGSSLGDITTRAREDGGPDHGLGRRFRLSGAKMWISAGDHQITENIIHLVLAKVVDEKGDIHPGSRGISLFVVPKRLPDGQINDVTVAGLNHKMGYRGLPNCALNFGEGKTSPDGAPGAVGWLVGEVGQGLPQMFQMMNEARVSVGLGAAMLAHRGYLMSLEYAQNRLQGRVEASPSSPQSPIIEHADVRRMLLAQKAISQGALALVLFSARLLDDEQTLNAATDREAAGRLLALLTPVTKTWPSEWAQVSLHHALQIHGGAGYTRDFEIEQLYRDNRLNPIHEGTTGIQGIDLVSRKLRRDKGAAFAVLAGRMRSTLDEAAIHQDLRISARNLATSLDRFERTVQALIAEPDERRAAAHGAPVLFALGHLVVGWLWIDQALMAIRALAAGEASEAGFLRGRIRACRHFAENELPSVTVWLDPVLSGSSLASDMALDEF